MFLLYALHSSPGHATVAVVVVGGAEENPEDNLITGVQEFHVKDV